ncbi:MAG: hypothetical protein IPK69_10825 [Phycisphaerales bacterium]|nr:MAG: hypothetical protein IPK69_10825 [Phycisphaerales bacterium]
MRLRTKTVRRLKLLAIILVVGAAAGGGLYAARQSQLHEATTVSLREGLAAADRHDYAMVQERLGSYLRRVEPSQAAPRAMLEYGRARRESPSPTGDGLRDAARWIGSYLSTSPTDRDVSIELLKVYERAGMMLEARDRARLIRPDPLSLATESDLPVLRAEVGALVGLRAPESQIMPLVRRIIDIRPLDVAAHLDLFTLLRDARKPEECAAIAAKLLEANPLDQRARLISLLATADLSRRSDLESLFPQLCTLVGLTVQPPRTTDHAVVPDDEVFVTRVASIMDALGGHEHAAAVLAAGALRTLSPELVMVAARRGLYAGRLDDVMQLRDDSGPRGEPGTLLLIPQVLAAEQRGDNAAADERLTMLEARGAFDYRAHAFALAARATMRSTPGDTKSFDQALAPVREALSVYAAEPILHFMLGEMLAGVGRTEEAIASWKACVELPASTGWALPHVSLSRGYLSLGLIEDAIKSADVAQQIAPRSSAAALARFSAGVARAGVAATVPNDAEALLRFADDALVSLEADANANTGMMSEIVPKKAALLAMLDRSKDATTFAESWTRSPERLGQNGLVELARVSARHHLGVEDQAIAAAERAFGMDANLASCNAAILADRGTPDEGLRVLDDAIAGASPEQKLDLSLARAVYLDSVHSDKAAEAWRGVVREGGDQARVLQAALRSSLASRDAEFLAQINRSLRAATGQDPESSVDARLASAQAILLNNPTLAQRDDAAAILRGICRDFPRMVDARVLLADALLMEAPDRGVRPMPSEALENLRLAAVASPNPGPIWLRVAAVLQSLQDFEAARTELERVARDNPTNHDLRRRAASMLRVQGADQPALAIYRDLVQTGGATPDPDLVLAYAELLSDTGETTEARRQYRSLVDANLSLSSIPIVSAALARFGDRDQAASVLAKLETLSISPGQRLVIVGESAELQGDFELALDRYAEACDAEPSHEDAWIRRIGLLLRRGDLRGAKESITRAKATLSSSAPIALLEQQTLVAEHGMSGLSGLADALANDPRHAHDAEIVRAIGRAYDAGQLDTPDFLVSLAQRYPASLPVQNLVVRQLLTLDPPELERAASVVSRSLSRFPTASEPARLATTVYSGLGAWPMVISSARAWRDRDPSSDEFVVAAIAMANLSLDESRRAYEMLGEVIHAAVASPSDPFSRGVIDIYVRAALASGHADEAESLVGPLIENSPIIRDAVWLPAASELGTLDVAQRWIERASASSASSSREDRLALAAAWSTLAGRFETQRAGFSTKALDILTLMRNAEPSDAGIHRILAQAFQRADRLDEAADSYRRVLQIDPVNVDAIVNLASILRAKPEHRAEALAMLEDAYTRLGANVPALNLALAQALLDGIDARLAQRDQTDPAPVAKRAVSLLAPLANRRPGDLSLQLTLAQAQDLAGDPAAAIAIGERLLRLEGLSKEVRAGIMNNVAGSILNTKSERAMLDHARELASVACADLPSAATFTTFARALRRLGARSEAIDRLREGIALEPASGNARVVLASLLMDGSHAEREEARGLVESLVQRPSEFSALSLGSIRELAVLRNTFSAGHDPATQGR